MGESYFSIMSVLEFKKKKKRKFGGSWTQGGCPVQKKPRLRWCIYIPRNTEDCEPTTSKKPEKGIEQILPTALRGNQLVRLPASGTLRMLSVV